MDTHTQKDTHTKTHTQRHTHTHTHTHMHTQSHTHTQTQIHTHPHKDTHTHTHTLHSHTHAHRTTDTKHATSPSSILDLLSTATTGRGILSSTGPPILLSSPSADSEGMRRGVRGHGRLEGICGQDV